MTYINRNCENCHHWLTKSKNYAWVNGASVEVGQCCAADATDDVAAPYAQTNGDSFVFTQPNDSCLAFKTHPDAAAYQKELERIRDEEMAAIRFETYEQEYLDRLASYNPPEWAA
jgi:hypothetical protein